MCINQYFKNFTCGKNFEKKIFFPGSVFEIKTVKQINNHTNQQPQKYKAAPALISNHKL